MGRKRETWPRKCGETQRQPSNSTATLGCMDGGGMPQMGRQLVLARRRPRESPNACAWGHPEGHGGKAGPRRAQHESSAFLNCAVTNGTTQRSSALVSRWTKVASQPPSTEPVESEDPAEQESDILHSVRQGFVKPCSS